MPPGGQAIHKAAQGHGDAIDFRSVCFRDERDMHVGCVGPRTLSIFFSSSPSSVTDSGTFGGNIVKQGRIKPRHFLDGRKNQAAISKHNGFESPEGTL